MTSPTPMTREELLELAALDAFGLLDEYEAALYTRSFHHAPAAVQDEVRQLQAAFASDTELLPDTEPEPLLRQRVLRAVSQAIEAESIELAPLAMIGRNRARRPQTDGRLIIGASGLLWRAAAFTLAGAVLVLAYFVLTVNQENDRLKDTLVHLLTQESVEWAAGDGLLSFAGDPSCTRIPLNCTEAGVGAEHAVIYVNHETSEAFLFTLNLPVQPDYTLVGKSRDGREMLSQSFDTLSAFGGVHLQLGTVTTTVASTLIWQITDSSGTVILTTA